MLFLYTRQYITDNTRETCKLNLFLPFWGEKTFCFTSSWIFKRSAFYHISLNCHVKPSSHGRGLIVEQGNGSWNVNRYQVIHKGWTHMPSSYYAFSLFFLREFWEFLNCKIIKHTYIVIDVNKSSTWTLMLEINWYVKYFLVLAFSMKYSLWSQKENSSMCKTIISNCTLLQIFLTPCSVAQSLIFRVHQFPINSHEKTLY